MAKEQLLLEGELTPFHTVVLRLPVTDETQIAPALERVAEALGNQVSIGSYPVSFLAFTVAVALQCILKASTAFWQAGTTGSHPVSCSGARTCCVCLHKTQETSMLPLGIASGIAAGASVRSSCLESLAVTVPKLCETCQRLDEEQRLDALTCRPSAACACNLVGRSQASCRDEQAVTQPPSMQ